MKKQHLIVPLIIFSIILSMNVYYNTTGKTTDLDNGIIISDVVRPVFEFSNPNPMINPDLDEQQGAVIYADPSLNVTNVTVWYSFAGGTNETLPLLFGDDGGFNLSWTTPVYMTYDNETSIAEGKAMYNYTFWMESDFTVFRVRLNEYEEDWGISNVITTNVMMESFFTYDFYSDIDEIELYTTLTNYSIINFGYMFREVNSAHDLPFQNVTVALVDEGEQRNVTTSFTHSFDSGTQIEVRGFITQNDTVLNELRILHENKAHLVTLTDGTPDITLDIVDYTNELNVSLWWNASTATRDNVSIVRIDWGDGGAEEDIDIERNTVYHEYSGEGEYNISVTILAGLALGTKNHTLIIDQTNPFGELTYVDPEGDNDNTVTFNGQKEITVKFNASDEGGSGIEKIILSTDEGNEIELIEEREGTLLFLEAGEHTINMTVYDKAGNIYQTSIDIEIVESEGFPGGSAVPFPFGVLPILGLISLVLIKRKKN